MFFNKYKKIGKEVGLAAKATLLTPFNNSRTQPPKGFFEDFYIFGFSASYLQNHLATLGSLEWKGEDVSKAMDAASKILDPSKEFSKFQFESFASGVFDIMQTKEEFINGKYHADLIIRVLNGIGIDNIPNEIKDPLLLRAKKEKNELLKNIQIKSLNKYGDSQLAGVLLNLTLWERIYSNYI